MPELGTEYEQEFVRQIRLEKNILGKGNSRYGDTEVQEDIAK